MLPFPDTRAHRGESIIRALRTTVHFCYAIMQPVHKTPA
ncbi:hypothetical protein BLAT2472_20795 [Burkholderia latens]